MMKSLTLPCIQTTKQHPMPIHAHTPQHRDGRAAGLREGRELGVQKGSEIAREVGFYAGAKSCRCWPPQKVRAFILVPSSSACRSLMTSSQLSF